MEGNDYLQHEQNVIDKIEQLLPKGYTLARDVRLNNLIILDAVIYHGRHVFAMVEVKHDIRNVYLRADTRNRFQTISAITETDSAYKILTDGKWVISFKDYNELTSETILEDFESSFNNLFLKPIENQITQVSDEFLESFCIKLKDVINNHETIREKDFLKELTKEQLSKGIEIKESKNITFTESFEKSFFECILGTYKKKSICRYTSYLTLKRILDDRRTSVCSIVGMNDKSECFYANQYLGNHNGYSDVTSSSEQKKLDDNSPVIIDEVNRYMIMSCTDIDQCDKLEMWRLYGDDARGVCIEYTIEHLPESFILAPVSYAKGDNSHPELDFIRDVKNIKIDANDSVHLNFAFRNFGLWQHFFKPYDYSYEKEVRLLFVCPPSEKEKYKWIKTNDNVICPVMEFSIDETTSKFNNFPLRLNRILIGPKFPEQAVNKQQLELYAISRHLLHSGAKIDVLTSSINNYR